MVARPPPPGNRPRKRHSVPLFRRPGINPTARLASVPKPWRPWPAYACRFWWREAGGRGGCHFPYRRRAIAPRLTSWPAAYLPGIPGDFHRPAFCISTRPAPAAASDCAAPTRSECPEIRPSKPHIDNGGPGRCERLRGADPERMPRNAALDPLRRTARDDAPERAVRYALVPHNRAPPHAPQSWPLRTVGEIARATDPRREGGGASGRAPGRICQHERCRAECRDRPAKVSLSGRLQLNRYTTGEGKARPPMTCRSDHSPVPPADKRGPERPLGAVSRARAHDRKARSSNASPGVPESARAGDPDSGATDYRPGPPRGPCGGDMGACDACRCRARLVPSLGSPRDYWKGMT